MPIALLSYDDDNTIDFMKFFTACETHAAVPRSCSMYFASVVTRMCANSRTELSENMANMHAGHLITLHAESACARVAKKVFFFKELDMTAFLSYLHYS